MYTWDNRREISLTDTRKAAKLGIGVHQIIMYNEHDAICSRCGKHIHPDWAVTTTRYYTRSGLFPTAAAAAGGLCGNFLFIGDECK